MKKRVPEETVFWYLLGLALVFPFGFISSLPAVQKQSSLPPPAEITPTIDRLAIPVLPEDPTQVELGSNIYYYHCMPCHGDLGQGLTDEFRGIWEEEHQNCWRRGCHGGREKDEGFPLPTAIPAINIASRSRQRFPEPDDLFNYLRLTHPPQRPGTLKENEYRALVAYLFAMNARPAPGDPTSTETIAIKLMNALRVSLLAFGILLIAVVITHWHHERHASGLTKAAEQADPDEIATQSKST